MRQDTEFTVVYSKRKTIGLTVERDHRIIVHAPEGLSREQIEKAVATKRLWLYQKLRHERKYDPVPHRKEFVTGESLLYLGRHYRLELTDDVEPGVRFQQKFVISRRCQDQAKALFQEWYTLRAREHLTTRVRFFAAQLGVAYNHVLISDLKYRWGSCTPNDSLNFNWRIVKAPLFVIDYLVVHELAHLLEANHTKRFWTIVSVQVPKWETAKHWLRDHGALLETDF